MRTLKRLHIASTQMGPDGVTSSMPSYGWAMTEPEMWSIIHYLRQTTMPPVDGGAQ